MNRPPCLALLLGLAGPVVAQQPTTAPPPLPLKPAAFPPFREAVLPNGLRLVVVENHRLPVVSLSLSFGAGKTVDPAGKEGLAAMAAGLLTKGAGARTADQVSNAIERVGGSIGAGAGSDFLTVSAGVLSKDAALAFDLTGDAVVRPRFDTTEVSLLRTQTLSGLDLERSQPASVAERVMNQMLFGGHPYARHPTPASVKSIARSDLLAFQKARLKPAGALLVVAGDISLAEARRHATRAFKGWIGGPAPLPAATPLPARTKTGIYLVHRPGSVQSNILAANLTYRPGDPRHYAAVVANRILGDGADSRLFKILREQKSWTYGAYSALDRRRGGGTFTASTEVRTEVTDSALAEMISQLRRIGTEPVPAEELAAAQSAITGSYPLNVQTAEQVAGAVTSVRLYGLPADYLETYRLKIGAVTGAEVLAAAKALIRPDGMVIVVVGDGAKVLAGLKPIGPVTILDIDGKPIGEGDLNPSAKPLPLALDRLTAGRDSFAIRVQGNTLGWSVTTVEDTPEGKRLTEHTSLGGFVEQQTTVDVSATGAMLRVRQSGKAQGQPTSIQLDYRDGRVKGKASTVSQAGPKELVIDTTVTAGTIDDNAIQGLVPSLPWSATSEWSFAVFAGGQNESKVTTLKVVGIETVALPAGATEAYKVEFSGGWQPATFWVSTAAPHRLLKIGVTNTPVEIVRAK